MSLKTLGFFPLAMAALRLGAATLAAPDPHTAALLEDFSGHIAVLPAPGFDRYASSPVGQALEELRWTQHMVRLSPAQFADTNSFNAPNFPVALYLGFESYYQNIKRPGDGDAALRNYLAGGGTLLVLPTGPFPFYYNEATRPGGAIGALGLSIGAGSFEAPPATLRLSFVANTNASIIPWPQLRFPFPAPYEGDQRWRPARAPGDKQARYVPLLTLFDDKGGNHGDGVALLERDTGLGKTSRVFYAWCSLMANRSLRGAVLPAALRIGLENAALPTPRYACWRTPNPPAIDGQISEAAWINVPGGKLRSVTQGEQTTTGFMGRWDAAFLYLALGSEQPGEFRCFHTTENGIAQSPFFNIRSSDNFKQTNASEVSKSNRVAKHVTGNGRWSAETAIPWSSLGRNAPLLDSSMPIRLEFVPATRENGTLYAWPRTSGSKNAVRSGTLQFAADPFSDDFENRSAPIQGSTDWQTVAGEWRVDTGQLVGKNCVLDNFEIRGAARGSLGWRNYACSVRFKVEQRGSDWRDGPWFGFRCREDGDGYTLMFTDRDCQWHKVIYGVTTSDANPLARVPWKPDQEWHTLRVEVVGNTFSASLDGRTLFRGKDDAHLNLPSLRSGKVVLASRRASQSQGETVVRFDDFIVELLGK